MRAYHFIPTQFAIAAIAMRRLKIARLEDLNDPFDFISADLTDLALHNALSRTKRHLSEDKGLLCFSRSYRNPVLWSHYADAHRGICLGFDIADELARPVVYQSERVSIPRERYSPEFLLNQDDLLRIIETKFIGWAYEDEVRLYIGLDHSTKEHGLCFKEFDHQLQLREIFLGVRCDIPQKAIQEVADRLDSGVCVQTAALARQSFEVTVQT